MAKIHPSAVVDPKAELADDVEIGPLCVVGPNVKIGKGTKLIAQCNITGWTTLGENNVVHPTACLGGDPQDHGFKGTESYLIIGDGNTFREGFTAHIGTKEGSATVIGNDCYFMANTHVAHNCKVGNNVTMVNSSGIAGYVTVGDGVIFSGLSMVHQFVTIGRYAMLSGGAAISQDLPPFVICTGRNSGVRAINSVGLKRNGFSAEKIKQIKKAYKIFYHEQLNTSDALARMEAELEQCDEVVEFIEFIRNSKRGVVKDA